ncbi:hypothetical protein JYU34_012413 [Plutella xylostella]|uniref:Uncharacterized protein n=1 Tax=Plutella xylostella TaxID=51655 RepID=A0ABQ7QB99_PLUXY|nr:hypothetical protein JYU34_012413 [Plutella xylostella]
MCRHMERGPVCGVLFDRGRGGAVPEPPAVGPPRQTRQAAPRASAPARATTTHNQISNITAHDKTSQCSVQ